MKELLRKVFWFILSHFEKGDEPYAYKPLSRIIMIVVGVLFLALSAATVYLTGHTEGYGFLIPVVVFCTVGLVAIIVGTLGSDRAVAKVWGNRS